MADKITKEQRSQVMRAVKSKDSKMELSLRSELSRRGLRYRKHVSRLPGKPDIVFIGKKVAVFVDSCFWHGCGKHCRMPASNKKYWNEKIEKNRARDRTVNKKYRAIGWRVLRIWEHQLLQNPEKVITKIEISLGRG